ncbi:MAG: GGDEF domain-containing protein [Terriglobales bacterium]
MNSKLLKSLLVPGGALLFAAIIVLEAGLLSVSAPAVDFYYFAVFCAGVLLAWRFHSSRTFFTLLTLMLAHRALEFFSAGHPSYYGTGHIALEVLAFVLPLNFVVFSYIRERGFSVPAMAPYLSIIFLESVVVALLCRPGSKSSPMFFHASFGDHSLFGWSSVPRVGLFSFVAAIGFLAYRFFHLRQPLESGFLWSLTAVFVSFQKGGVHAGASAYFATAGLILLSSIIENSYILAYHDELTSLPGRRAFNTALLRLEPPYTIAVVDIDHFKRFNDIYGHDTGDQVLRLVASKLARVSGAGKAFRVGGEEFTILFAGAKMQVALPHLEGLRAAVETSFFHVREVGERRNASRGTDRRAKSRKSSKKAKPNTEPFALTGEGLSVTISIGVAEPAPQMDLVLQVIENADKALYRAKQGGRNRVETFQFTRGTRAKRKSA